MSTLDELFVTIVRKDECAAVALLEGDRSLGRAHDPRLGSTALHLAAHRGLSLVVNALLRDGADPNALERVSGTTALHWAAEGGHAAVCARLLDAGAGIDAVDDWFALAPLGWATVVDWAPHLRDDRQGTARHLLERGAALDLFSAIILDRDEAFMRIVVERPLELTATLGFAAAARTPLHVAAERGFIDAARALVAAGAPVNARTAHGETVLALADTMADTLGGSAIDFEGPMRALLLDHGAVDELADLPAHVDALDGATRTALLFACARRGLDDDARLLLAKGADPRATRRVLDEERAVAATPARYARICGRHTTAAVLDVT